MGNGLLRLYCIATRISYKRGRIVWFESGWGVFMSRLAIIAAGALLLGMVSPALADSSTFGQFTQKASNQRLFRYLNKDTATTKGAEIYTTSTASSTAHGTIPIYYVMGVNSLPLDLLGQQDAHLSVDFISTSGTTGPVVGNSRVQMFGSGTITITRDTAALEGMGDRTNLLTLTFTNAELDASNNNGSFTFKSNDDSVINYSSDFLDFAGVISKDFSFSFSGASPKFQAALGSSSVNTRFSGTGTFASDPAPLTFSVPEASTWAMLVIGFSAVGAMMRTGRRSKDLFAA